MTDWKKYQLTDNWFVSIGADPRFPMAGRQEFLSRLTQTIKDFVGAQANRGLMLIGDYGMGKTFTLMKFEQAVITEQPILAVRLPLLPSDPAPRFGVDFIRRIYATLGKKWLIELCQNSSLDFLDSVDGFIGQILTNLKSASNSDIVELSYDYLTSSQSLTKSELTQIQVRRPLTTTTAAFEAFFGLMCLAKSNQKLSLLILVDEMEYLFTEKTSAKAAEVINNLRVLLDLYGEKVARGFGTDRFSNVIFLYALSDDGFDRLQAYEKRRQSSSGGGWRPFLDRINPGHRFFLEPLNREETESLIELRMSVDPLRHRQQPQPPFIPYTEDFIDYIYKVTVGKPRDIVYYCGIVLSEGLRKGIARIDKEFARHILEGFHMVQT